MEGEVSVSAPRRPCVYLEDLRNEMPSPVLTTLNVLCVEDDMFHQKVLSGAFDCANRSYEGSLTYNVSMVSSADEALEMVRTLSLDLIFVDVMLDGLPGDELLPQLRKLVPADVAIVMASQLSQVCPMVQSRSNCT